MNHEEAGTVAIKQDFVSSQREHGWGRTTGVPLCCACVFVGICVLTCVVSAGVWRNIRPDLVHCDFKDVCFADAAHGWAVGSSGYVFRTTDGGAHWSGPLEVCTTTLNGVDFVDTLRGWAVGAWYILHTTDGGSTWEHQESGIVTQLAAVDFVDSLHGWAVGYEHSPYWATVLRTTNGGVEWIDESPGRTCRMKDVCFVDTLWGWAVATSDTPNLMRSTDGGQSWHSLDLSTTRGLESAFFLDRDMGWVVGDIDSVYGTTNGGSSWMAHPIEVEELQDITFLDARDGWATSEHRLFRTTSGGDMWSEVPSGTYNPLAAVEFSHRRNGVAVGKYTAIVRSSDGGEHWSRVLEQSNDLLHIIHVNPGLAWAVGARGTILRTADGWNTWEWQDGGTEANLLGADFVDTLRGWVCGGPPAVMLCTVDGGESWEPQSIESEGWLTDVTFVNSQVGWAIEWCEGIWARLFRTTNGGDLWEPREVGQNVHSVGGGDFMSPDTAWIAASRTYGPWPDNEAVICNTTNGGTSWEVRFHWESYVSMEDVDFATPDSGWAVSGSNVVFRTTNAGESWDPIIYPGGLLCLYDLEMVDTRRGWALDGTITIHTSDGGETWVPDSVDGGSRSWWLYGIEFLDAERGWACGEWGSVWEYDAQVGVEEGSEQVAPTWMQEILQLGPCCPNPFRTSTAISFTVPRNRSASASPSLVRLDTYNVLGQSVATLVDEEVCPGRHRVVWHGTDNTGRRVSSGLYLVRLEAGQEYACQKIVLLR